VKTVIFDIKARSPTLHIGCITSAAVPNWDAFFRAAEHDLIHYEIRELMWIRESFLVRPLGVVQFMRENGRRGSNGHAQRGGARILVKLLQAATSVAGYRGELDLWAPVCRMAKGQRPNSEYVDPSESDSPR
jgi:hypothetical protein